MGIDTKQLKVLLPSGNQELSEVQDSLRGELMAEMSVEGTQKQKLGDQIKAEMKQ